MLKGPWCCAIAKGTPGWSLWCGTSITPSVGLGAPRGAAASPKSISQVLAGAFGWRRECYLRRCRAWGSVPLWWPRHARTQRSQPGWLRGDLGLPRQGRTETWSQHGEGKGRGKGEKERKETKRKKKGTKIQRKEIKKDEKTKKEGGKTTTKKRQTK